MSIMLRSQTKTLTIYSQILKSLVCDCLRFLKTIENNTFESNRVFYICFKITLKNKKNFLLSS